MTPKYTDKAKNAINRAKRISKRLDTGYIGTEHLLLSLLSDESCTASEALKEAGLDYDTFLQMVSTISPEKQSDACVCDRPEYTPKFKDVLDYAKYLAECFNIEKIGTEILLLSLLSDSSTAAFSLIYSTNLDFEKITMNLIASTGLMPSEIRKFAMMLKEKRGVYKNSLKQQKPSILEQYSRDLTNLAKEGKLDPVIGREVEIRRVIQTLSRRNKNNPCLVGEPGVGKTAIVEGLAKRIVDGLVPDSVKDKRLLVLDLSAMVAGTKYRGEFEERIKNLIAEVTRSKDCILFIDELHTLIGAGGASGSLDASNILKPALSRGEIQLIGATTLDEYRKYIEKDAALERRFQPVNVEPPTNEETLLILKGIRENYEKHHNVNITDEALKSCVTLSDRYINDRFMPDKAIDIMDEAAAKIRIKNYKTTNEFNDYETRINGLEEEMVNALHELKTDEFVELKIERDAVISEYEKKKKLNAKDNGRILTVDEATVAEVVSDWTKIPLSKLSESDNARLSRMDSTLKKRIIGQDEAVEAVSRAIKRGRIGLKEKNRPIGSFLFLGPTGVGKTELCKALTEVLFGNEKALIRVDMSEYMEKHTVSKMIGSPPGYVGFEEGGQLSEKVRRNPYSVVLFDEIEKAHPDVFNILLQVLDEGNITDSNGRSVSFKNCVIIMTSNAGANRIVEPKHLGFVTEVDEGANHNRMKSGVMEEVKKIFKPEFINRIDEIVVFHALNEADMKKIVTLLVNQLSVRIKEELNISLSVTDSVKKYIVEKGCDKKYGARPLKRAIQTMLEDKLAQAYIDGVIHDGDNIKMTFKNNEIFVKVLD